MKGALEAGCPKFKLEVGALISNLNPRVRREISWATPDDPTSTAGSVDASFRDARWP